MSANNPDRGRNLIESGKYAPKPDSYGGSDTEPAAPQDDRVGTDVDVAAIGAEHAEHGAEHDAEHDGAEFTGHTENPVIYPSPDNPMGVARRLQQTWFTVGDERTLLNWCGSWMRWDTSRWIDSELAAVRGVLYAALADAVFIRVVKGVPGIEPWKPNRRKIGDVLEALHAVSYLPDRVTAPSWMAGAHTHDTVVSCANGLLVVEARTLVPHTPTYFNRVAVPYAYDADAPEPVGWLKFLSDLWQDDADSVAALQEWFGYIVSGRTDLQKILLIVGPTRSGKGVIGRILAAMVGGAAGPVMSSLGTNFGLSPLIDAPLAVVSDARLGDATSAIVERLLSISGEDRLTIDRKYRESWTGTLPTRFMLLSNELPRFGDASGAIAGRFIILQTTRSFLDNEDIALTGKLRTELPGILKWSLAGLDRLIERGRFTVPEASRAATLLLRDLASPVSAFVRDECVVGPAFMVERPALHAAFKRWCEENSHKVTSSATFGRDLRAVVPTIGTARPGSGNTRRFFHTGIQLRGDDDE